MNEQQASHQGAIFANRGYSVRQQQETPANKMRNFLESPALLSGRSTPSGSSPSPMNPLLAHQSRASYDSGVLTPLRYLDKSQEPDMTWIMGLMLLIATYVMFVASMYAIIVSKIMPVTGNKVLDWIKDDRYYCYLVPLTFVPVTLTAVTWNW